MSGKFLPGRCPILVSDARNGRVQVTIMIVCDFAENDFTMEISSETKSFLRLLQSPTFKCSTVYGSEKPS